MNTENKRDREVEAATDALLADSGLPRYGGHRATVERRMRIAFDAADRVRDARSDEELHSENERLRELYANQANIKARGWTVDHLMECEEALRMAESRVAELEAEARSPQDEDHEAGIEAAAQAICGIAGWGPHYGGEHREMAERAVAAYLARVSPSRGGA